MQCINDTQIKQEVMDWDVRTVILDDQPQQKVILSPRIEIHRVVKQTQSSPSSSSLQHQSPDNLIMNDRAQIIFQPARSPPPLTITGPHAITPSQQRVRVIKDGRCYDEHSLSVTQNMSACDATDDHAILHPVLVSQQTPHPLPPPPPPPPDDSKKFIVNRKVNVISSVDREKSSGVFRPPVVSSTSTSMRPPPPPPPPRIKPQSTEEPSSSIPDLGE